MRQSSFEEARKAYEKALELEPNNNFIHTNYAQFREIYDRQNLRRFDSFGAHHDLGGPPIPALFARPR